MTQHAEKGNGKNVAGDGPGDKNLKKKPGVVIPFTPLVPLTEDDVAQAFATAYHDRLRFDHDARRWYLWTGVRWEKDKKGLGFDLARRACRKYRGTDEAMSSRSAAKAVEFMAAHDQRLATTSDSWDADAFALGTPDGTLDLRKGALRAASRDDLITKLATVAPNNAAHPRWNQFLAEATGSDQGMQRLLQQWGGYCLTGSTKEQTLLFVHGPGGNGKSVFLTVLSDILGDYAKTAAMEIFVASRQQRHLAELAMLRGARLVSASETERSQAWAQSRINALTGGDRITANFMRQNHFTYLPTFKLTIIGNHRPRLESVNDAARRRFIIVPFVHKPAKPDKTLGTKLKEEYPAIMAWMIEGCLDWQQNGLVLPDCVQKATEDYFSAQDLFGRWLSEECELDPQATCAASKLYKSWCAFAEEHGEHAGTAVSFGEALAQHGLKKKTSNGVKYIGVDIKSISNLQFAKVDKDAL